MPKKLEGKVAVITGGTEGIGLATAKLFVKEGAYVFITGRRHKELDEAVKAIGTNVSGVQGDVAKLVDLDRLYETVSKAKGRIDIVFANAGVGEFVPFGAVTEEHFEGWRESIHAAHVAGAPCHLQSDPAGQSSVSGQTRNHLNKSKDGRIVMQFAPERAAQTNAMSRGSNRLNDGVLVLAANNHHSTAFATLSDQYREQLYRAAHRITRTREDAEDAVQDTLLRAFVHLGDFEGRSNFGTWLTRITVNSALMILRRKRATHKTAIGDNNDFGDGLRYEITDHAPNPETRYAQTEELRILKTAIQRLRPNLRVVVQIHLQGRSMRETAETLGISLSAAKGRLFHAKKALRRSTIGRVVMGH